ncbi:MAG TPA: low temperature requirement protein A [Jatrophihabitantaceae bacterium]|nr:low temperature requirement protein A [Jatrophihabitantaceae bacterium]
MTATRSDVIERVSTLELFFDLVFVFTITQLTCGSMWSWRRDRF